MFKKVLALLVVHVMILGIFNLSAFAVSSVALTDDESLLVWYDFDQVNGIQVPDKSNNGFNGTLYGGAAVVDGYLNLNGSGAYLQMPQGISPRLTSYTVSMFVKPRIQSANTFLFTLGNSDSTGYIFFSTTNAGNNVKFGATLTNWQGEGGFSVPSPFSTNDDWRHFAFTYDYNTKTVICYVDGVEFHRQGNVTVAPVNLGNTYQNYIGRSQYSPDAYYKGMVDDFRIYSRALSANEVAELAVDLNYVKDSLTLGDLSQVRSDITLPVTGPFNTTITWQSSNEEYLTSDGIVKRPPNGTGNVDVTLTATISTGAASVTKEFTVTILQELSEEEKLEFDLDSIVLEGNLSNLRDNLTLPKKGTEGSTIEWRSSHPDYLSHDGVILKRPEKGSGNLEVTLTATAYVNGKSKSKDFTISLAEDEGYYGYLFTYFTGNSGMDEQIRYALSTDGFSFKALNGNDPMFISDKATTGGVRDPHILRLEEPKDGYKYYMVATDLRTATHGWTNQNIVLYKSKDLINWEHTVVEIAKLYPRFSTITRAWAPQTIYDKDAGKYMVYWSMKFPNDQDKLYYAYANDDFTGFESEPQILFYPPDNNSIIDADIIPFNNQYHLFYKYSGSSAGIKKAVSDKVTGPYTDGNKFYQLTTEAVEGSGMFKLINSDKYVLMYDVYASGRYEFAVTTDLENYTKVPNNAALLGVRHGTVMPITKEEYDLLNTLYGDGFTVEEKVEPILHYTFDEIEGTKVVDVSGNGNDGTMLNGATTQSGKIGNALYLNGSGAYVKLPNDILKRTRELTVSAWVKTSSSIRSQRIVDFGSHQDDSYIYFTTSGSGGNDGYPQFTIREFKRPTGESRRVSATKKIRDNEWTLMTGVIKYNEFDGTYMMTMYMNGERVSRWERSNVAPYQIGGLNNMIGKSLWSSDPAFSGYIDDFRIYNRALSPKEILDLADAPLMIGDSMSKQVKQFNVVFDQTNNTIYLPVKLGTDITNFDPEFAVADGVEISPSTPQDFSKGPVKYTVTKDGQSREYTVTVSVDNNPVLEGYYADPEVLYYDGKFYIYPTTDGYASWSGRSFSVFSSEDLVNWKHETVILDLPKDTVWSTGNAWAPCIIEKDGKFYFYFSANVNGGAKAVGVAVADSPTGPFVDSGKPLVNVSPTGGGQQIDPDVFHDPVSGKYYLYWGNGYMAVAELADDMVSLVPGTTKVITPQNAAYREAPYVFYRNGKYYFLWSQDDTGNPNYQVRYGVSDSPTGPIVGNYQILFRDDSNWIYGPAHNSVLQIPGTDEWYIVYHRISRPDGYKQIDQGVYNFGPGNHREVCIDRMYFDENGNILPITPTLKGVDPFVVNTISYRSVSSLSSGAEIIVDIEFPKGSIKTDTAVAIICVYDNDNKLISVKTQQLEGLIGEDTVTKTITYTAPEEVKAGYKFKLFLLDQFINLKPLAIPFTLNAE